MGCIFDLDTGEPQLVHWKLLPPIICEGVGPYVTRPFVIFRKGPLVSHIGRAEPGTQRPRPSICSTLNSLNPRWQTFECCCSLWKSVYFEGTVPSKDQLITSGARAGEGSSGGDGCVEVLLGPLGARASKHCVMEGHVVAGAFTAPQ